MREVYIRANSALKDYTVRWWDISFFEPEYRMHFHAHRDSHTGFIDIESDVEGTDEKEVARKFISLIRSTASDHLNEVRQHANDNIEWMENDYVEAKKDESHYLASSLELFIESLDSINLR